MRAVGKDLRSISETDDALTLLMFALDYFDVL